MRTYWLYYGDTVVTGVRMPVGTSDMEVRAKALGDLARVPLCDRPTENPSDKARRILGSHIRVFNEGRCHANGH